MNPNCKQRKRGDDCHWNEQAVRTTNKIVLSGEVEKSEVDAEITREALGMQSSKVEQQRCQERRRRNDRSNGLKHARQSGFYFGSRQSIFGGASRISGISRRPVRR